MKSEQAPGPATTTTTAATMLSSAIAKSGAANDANAASVAKLTAILHSKRRRVVPFPEFDRWRWIHDSKLGPRDEPERSTKIVHPLPEDDPPPDFGFTLEHCRENVAGMSDETLAGHLAQLDSNLKNNTMSINLGVALLEAQAARAEGLTAFRVEYARRSRPWFTEEATVQRKAEKAVDVAGDANQ